MTHDFAEVRKIVETGATTKPAHVVINHNALGTGEDIALKYVDKRKRE